MELWGAYRRWARRRPDDEHNQALIRVLIVALLLINTAYVDRNDPARGATLWAINLSSLAFSALLLGRIILRAGPAPQRRLLGAFHDNLAATAFLVNSGPMGALAIFVFPFVTVGNGFRFGVRYLAWSGVLGAVGMTFLMLVAPEWRSYGIMGAGVLVSHVIVAVYTGALLQRLHLTQERLEKMATSDVVTGLPNRRFFMDRLAQMVIVRDRRPMACLYLDLDGFKEVNDRCGHDVGDELLAEVARRVLSSIRGSDLAARFGGDEFTVVLDAPMSPDGAVIAAERIIHSIEAIRTVKGRPVDVSASVGISFLPSGDGGRPALGEELLRAADDAMYVAKRSGKGQSRLVQVATGGHGQAGRERAGERAVEGAASLLGSTAMALLLGVGIAAASPVGGAAQDLASLLTTPERTGYEETSTHAQVLAFLREVDRASPLITLDSMGATVEGRMMPLVIVGRVDGTSPEAVRATGRTRVYLQGNIHAGEVEGKEVLQILLREIAQGRHLQLLDSLVLLVNPIYNADGNERFDLRNRGRQHGPLRGSGQRPNAQGLDLNRDHMKTESPEAKALTSMLARYDPQLGVDLHTTNGSLHGYHLTYSPPLHPNTHPAIISLLRERWLPELTANVKREHGWDFHFYGNFQGEGSARGWYTFEHGPRFNNNYVGIRNRIAILSEAYSYATFEDRIAATRYFVDEVLDYAWRHASELRRIVEAADAESVVGRTLATRARVTPVGVPTTILVGDVTRELNPYSGDTIFRRRDVRTPTAMGEHGTFVATDSAVVGRAYFVPPAWVARAAPQLAQHGVRTRTLARDTTVAGARLRIDSTTVAPRPFQGHRERQLFGGYETATLTLPAGTVVVDMAQPLARLAFLLLEPRSDDGLVDWNFLDPGIERERYYPIVKTLR